MNRFQKQDYILFSILCLFLIAWTPSGTDGGSQRAEPINPYYSPPERVPRQDSDAPPLVVSSPENRSWTNQTQVTVEGVTSPGVSLTVNEIPVPLEPDGSFRYELPLSEGENLIQVIATLGAESHVQDLLIFLKNTPPLVSINIPEKEIYRSPVIRLIGNTETGSTVLINGERVPITDTGAFEMDLELAEGPNLIRVDVEDLAGNKTLVTRQVTYQPGGEFAPILDFARSVTLSPAMIYAGLGVALAIVLIAFFRRRKIRLDLSLDQEIFSPGLPGEGKVLLIYLTLNRSAQVSLRVLNEEGALQITLLHERRRTARQHTFSWNGYDEAGEPVPPGVYSIEASAGIGPMKAVTEAALNIELDILAHRSSQI